MEVFEAIGDPVRREILVALAREGSLSAGEIAGRFAISRPAVSRHLRVLRESGVVHDEVSGRRRIYRLAVDGLQPLRAWLTELAPQPADDVWSARFDALDTERGAPHPARPFPWRTEGRLGRDHDPTRDDEGDSMSPTPTGEVRHTGEGRDLVLVRELPGSIADAWASLTESERTGRWFASWTGDGRVGGAITLTLVAEEGSPTAEATIEAC